MVGISKIFMSFYKLKFMVWRYGLVFMSIYCFFYVCFLVLIIINNQMFNIYILEEMSEFIDVYVQLIEDNEQIFEWIKNNNNELIRKNFLLKKSLWIVVLLLNFFMYLQKS